jgi:hypothetical protein
MNDVRKMNQNQRKELINQIMDSGHYHQEIFELLLKCPIHTEAELNIELYNNPKYYPKYLKKKELTQIDIYWNIITDLEEIGNEGWALGPMQRQIYPHLIKLKDNEERLTRAGRICKILEELSPDKTEGLTPVLQDDNKTICWEPTANGKYYFDSDAWTNTLSTLIRKFTITGQPTFLYICRDNYEISFEWQADLTEEEMEDAEKHEEDEDLRLFND